MRDFSSQGELSTAAGKCSQLYDVRCVLQERVRRACLHFILPLLFSSSTGWVNCISFHLFRDRTISLF